MKKIVLLITPILVLNYSISFARDYEKNEQHNYVHNNHVLYSHYFIEPEFIYFVANSEELVLNNSLINKKNSELTISSTSLLTTDENLFNKILLINFIIGITILVIIIKKT